MTYKNFHKENYNFYQSFFIQIFFLFIQNIYTIIHRAII